MAKSDWKADPEAAFNSMMNAVEHMAGMFAHIHAAVPGAIGLAAQLKTLFDHVSAARAAMTPPVDPPPAADETDAATA